MTPDLRKDLVLAPSVSPLGNGHTTSGVRGNGGAVDGRGPHARAQEDVEAVLSREDNNHSK